MIAIIIGVMIIVVIIIIFIIIIRRVSLLSQELLLIAGCVFISMSGPCLIFRQRNVLILFIFHIFFFPTTYYFRVFIV